MVQTFVYRDARLTAESPGIDQMAVLRADPAVMLWVDVSESPDEEARRVLETFAVHALTVEDCLQDTPLPKVEEYGDYVYLVMHAIEYSRAAKFATTELDFILGKNFLVTYHRRPLRAVQQARERCLRSAGTPVRGPDRLAHIVLDLLVDNYLPALSELRAKVEEIEAAVLERSKERLDGPIVELRTDLASLRQILRPQREVAAELMQGSTNFFRPKLLPYLRDLHDEFLRVEEMATSWADESILIFRVYLNRSSHEANEGIRVLTALTGVTIPLLIVGGWFGMNFSNLPLKESATAYWVTLGATVAVTFGLIVFLRRRRWF